MRLAGRPFLWSALANRDGSVSFVLANSTKTDTDPVTITEAELKELI